MNLKIKSAKELSGSYKIEASENTVVVLNEQHETVGEVESESLRQKLLDPELDEAWVRISGKYQSAYVGELFCLPVMKDSGETAIELTCGGSMVTIPHLARTIADVYNKLSHGSILPSFLIKLDAETNQLFLVSSKAETIDNAYAYVLDPPAQLLNAIKNQPDKQVLKVTGLCYKNGDPVTVDLNDPSSEDSTAKLNNNHKKMQIKGTWSMDTSNNMRLVEQAKDVVRAGRSRWSDLQKKLQYMIDENVPEKIISVVFDHIRPCDAEWAALIPQPASVFRQSGSTGELTRCLAYRCRGLNLRLVGGKGSGKNTLAETVDWLLGRPQYRLQGNAELDKMDLLGSPTLNNGTMQYQISDLIRCLMAGGDVVLDEGNTIRPEVADVLHSLTDGSRSIQIPGYGLAVMSQEATITLTMNEGYMGTTKMNEATVDRFTPIQMEQPKSIESILKEAVPTASASDISEANRVYAQILGKILGDETNQGTLEPDCLTIRGFIDALRSADLVGLKQALLDNVADKPQDLYSRAELREVILAVCI